MLPKDLLGSVSSVELTITAHEQTQYNRASYIHIMDNFLVSKGSPSKNLLKWGGERMQKLRKSVKIQN